MRMICLQELLLNISGDRGVDTTRRNGKRGGWYEKSPYRYVDCLDEYPAVGNRFCDAAGEQLESSPFQSGMEAYRKEIPMWRSIGSKSRVSAAKP